MLIRLKWEPIGLQEAAGLKCNPCKIFSIFGKYKKLHKYIGRRECDEVMTNASWDVAEGGWGVLMSQGGDLEWLQVYSGWSILIRKGVSDRKRLSNTPSDQSTVLALFLYSLSNPLISFDHLFSKYRLNNFYVRGTWSLRGIYTLVWFSIGL